MKMTISKTDLILEVFWAALPKTKTECLLCLFRRRQKEEKGLKKAKPEVRANSLN